MEKNRDDSVHRNLFDLVILIVIHTVPLTSNLTRSCESLASDSQLSREYVFVCARGRAGGLARTCWSAREEGLVVSRVRVCLLARKGWWSRECVFVCSRGRAGGLASACLIPL